MQQTFFDYLLSGDIFSIFSKFIMPQTVNIIIAIAIFIIGKWLLQKLVNYVSKILILKKQDEMLTNFLCKVLYFAGLFIIIVAALSQVGFNTSSLVAVLGAAGLAVALSIKSSLQNFAAGLMLLILKPFTKGDFIETEKVSGTVLDLNILMLTLKTGDNKIIFVPNSQVFNSSITNYSSTGQRRIDLVIDVSYEANLKLTKSLIENVLMQEERVLNNLGITVVVGELGESSVKMYARVWVNTDDFFKTKCVLLEEIKYSLDKHNIEIPFNKLDINLKNQIK